MMTKEQIKGEVERICSQYMCPMTKESCYGNMCSCLNILEREQHFAMEHISDKLITYVQCENYALTGGEHIEFGRIEEEI